jgi:CheY-like chemotaxis protein/DNA-directed RNA polymerase subunit RPC12/RpoP
MLLKCPNCGSRIRMTTPTADSADKIVRYLCLGCEQIVRLDIVSDEIQTSSSAARPQLSHATRILVVDDNMSFLQIAEHLLTNAGFLVITAQDGNEALKKISEEHPDAILMDLVMPRMSGFEVLRTLRTNNHYKNFKHIPVLVTSAAYNPAESQLLHDLGASGFISKDAIPEFLVYRIKKLLERTDKIPKPQLPIASE